MPRPYINYSIDQLVEVYERAFAANDVKTMKKLARELKPRKTPRAKELKATVEIYLTNNAALPDIAEPNLVARRAPTGNTKHLRRNHPRKGAPKGAPSPIRLKPTSEQAQAIDCFLTGGSLKINAYAGTGKTATLEMLAQATQERGQYIAFNKNIVKDAKEKFPNTVSCSTTHGLAFRATPSAYKNRIEKMTGRMNANQLAELLGFKRWRVDKHHTLAPRSQGFLILDTIRKFAQSADLEPTALHVPQHGSLIAAPASTLDAVNEFAVKGANHVWRRMLEADDQIPLGHDGYLKLWALSDPIIQADYILLDEAQDTNPVVLDVLTKQQSQMIYVGDKYQQIYEWRGAVNAMEMIGTDHSTFLTTSFRFGEAIAEGATNILALLGEDKPMRGNPSIRSYVGEVEPQTILARTNASTITAIIDALDIERQPHLVGGNGELMEMLRGVQALKNGEASTVPDFFGFTNWQEVVEFAKSGEGEHLLTFVNLVEGRGERQLMWALNRTVDEERSDLIISTAHKSKGREWSKVRLMDDFLKSQPKRSPNKNNDCTSNGHDPAELRLFYVAFTRAREAIEVSPLLIPIIRGNPKLVHHDSPIVAKQTATSRPNKLKDISAHSVGMSKSSRQNADYTERKSKADFEVVPIREPSTNRSASKAGAVRESAGQKPAKRKGLFGWLLGK